MAIEWTQSRYGDCTYCRLGGFAVAVEWSSDRSKPGYNVSFANTVRLLKPIPDREAAKAAALRLARKKLTEALAALDAP